MSLSMYQATVPLIKTMLTAFSAVLDKGLASAEAKKYRPRGADRRAPRAGHAAAEPPGADRHRHRQGHGRPPYRHGSAELRRQRNHVRRAAGPHRQDAGVHRERAGRRSTAARKSRSPSSWAARTRPLPATATSSASSFPTSCFHCTTGYNILRHNGVDVGKRDFLGAF